MEFLCDSKYIILPASHYAAKKRLCFYEEDRLVYDLEVSLDYDQPDYRFPVNMERFVGKTLRLECDMDMEIGLEKADEFFTMDYSGKYRPLCHFTTKRGWMNDPNGLTYFGGRYLMYYQHNPAATTWENMHWGMAESTDLMHWVEKGDKLFPDERGTMFSGSAIVDTENVSGLGLGDEPPILFFYTAAGGTSKTSEGKPFTQCLCYSLDGGETLLKYEGNPVVEHIAGENRDPKVIRYQPDNSYIMALYLNGHDFALLKSFDLLHWEEIQRIQLPEDAECPDFYPLEVEGSGEVKWVLTAAADRYLVGTFDGQRFMPETPELRLNWGDASYAAQSWSDEPEGRRIRTAFVNKVIPGQPFSCCMDIPQEMTLKKVNGQLRLCAMPVRELEKLYLDTKQVDSFVLKTGEKFRHEVKSKACHIRLKAREGDSFRLSLFGLELEYCAEQSCLRCGEQEAPVPAENGMVEIEMIFDTMYTEIFAGKGSVFMGINYLQDSMLNRLALSGDGTEIVQITISELGTFY